MMEKEKVQFLFAPEVEGGFEELHERFEVILPPHEDKTATILASEFTIPVTREVIDSYPNLKLIANYAVGYNNIDVAYAHSKGIAVANTPKAVVLPTAELTIALLLSVSRRVAEWDRGMRAAQANHKQGLADGLGMDLYGKSVGIIGFGNIGQAVGKILRDGFGMKLFYNKRNRLTPDEEQRHGATFATQEEIFKTCDVVTLHMPYTPESHHLINRSTLALMKPTAILLNLARGAVVDEATLVEALQKGQIAGAGLDVFEHNDQPLEALYHLDNVVMTPHVGTQTKDARIAMARELSDNVIGFVYNDRVVALVKG